MGWDPEAGGCCLGEKGDPTQGWELGQGSFSPLFFYFLSHPAMGGGGGGGGALGEEEGGQLEALMILASDSFAWLSLSLSSSSVSTVSTMAVVTECLTAAMNPLQRALHQVKHQNNALWVKPLRKL